MQTPVYAGYEAIEDDVHAVRKRQTSRLWYRDPATPAAAPAEGTQRLAHSFLNGSTAGRVAGETAARGTSSLARRIA